MVLTHNNECYPRIVFARPLPQDLDVESARLHPNCPSPLHEKQFPDSTMRRREMEWRAKAFAIYKTLGNVLAPDSKDGCGQRRGREVKEPIE